MWRICSAPSRHYNPTYRQAGRPLYLPPPESGPAFLSPAPVVLGRIRTSQARGSPKFGFGSCSRTTPRVTLAVYRAARGQRVRNQTRRRGRSSSALDGRCGAVFLVGDVLAPGYGTAGVVSLLHRDVGHEPVRGGPVPVVLARLEEHAVAR